MDATQTALIIPEDDAWPPLAQAIQDCLGQIMGSSQKTYTSDLKHFVRWLVKRDLTPITLTRSHMIEYQRQLLEQYARATAARMIASTRSMLDEWSFATERANPASRLRTITVSNESTHIALSRAQAKQLLRSIDQSTLIGLRDYALILLLMRTGARRFEAAALKIGDLKLIDGHHVAMVRHGKEDKRRSLKLLPDVFKAIQRYLEASWRLDTKPEEPLFMQIRRGGHATHEALGSEAIARIVAHAGVNIGIDELTPHCLRATFITLALGSGAPLHKVRHTAGHEKSETTERYNRDKENLDSRAEDYLHDIQA